MYSTLYIQYSIFNTSCNRVKWYFCDRYKCWYVLLYCILFYCSLKLIVLHLIIGISVVLICVLFFFSIIFTFIFYIHRITAIINRIYMNMLTYAYINISRNVNTTHRVKRISLNCIIHLLYNMLQTEQWLFIVQIQMFFRFLINRDNIEIELYKKNVMLNTSN